MSKLDALTNSVASALSSAGVEAPAVEVAAVSDIGLDGAFGQSWLVLAHGELLRLDAEGTIDRRVAMDQVHAVRIDSMVGGSALMVDVDGDTAEMVRYSNAQAGKFGYVARWLGELVEHRTGKRDEAPTWDYKPPRTACPQCGLPLADEFAPCPACTHKGRTLLRLFSYLKPYKNWAVMLALFTIAGTILELVPPIVTKALLDDVLARPDEKAATAPTTLIGPALRSIDSGAVALLAGIGCMVVMHLISMAFSIVHGRLHARLGLNVATDIRNHLFERLHALSLQFFDKRPTGTVISHVTHDSDRIYIFIVDVVRILFSHLLLVIGIFFVMLWFDWQLTLFLLLPLPLVYFGARWFWRRIRSIFHRAWQRHSKLHDVVNDLVSGVRVVRAFAQEDQAGERFETANVDVRDYTMRGELLWATFFPILRGGVTLGVVIVWFFGGLRVLQHHRTPDDGMSLGVLILFVTLLWRFYGPIMDFGPILNWASRCLTAAERVFEVLDAEPEQNTDDDLIALPAVRGEMQFRNLTFGYESHKPVLKNINLHVQPGEMIGLVGRSGAGKSTLINMICRFYVADAGALSIDGHDVRNVNLRDLRRQIGVVLQDPFLFEGTIADNIAFAKPDAAVPDIIRAAKAANAHEFIMKMPDAYDTEVGERGSRLSGGERQRISIARAILHDPRILILDEATSSVDLQTEKNIQQAITRLVQNRTTFAIAHRLSTLRNASRLLVLKEGKAVECGTHDELMANKGEYHDLVKTQREVSRMRSEADVVAG